MLVFVIRRSLQSAVVLFAMSLLVFASVHAIRSPVDQPMWAQYLAFLDGVAHGDVGRSFVHGTSALGLVLARMPATLELAITAMLIAVVLGIPLGVWAGLKPKGIAGRTIATGSILGFSLPTFWVGLMLILVFSVLPGWLPPNGRGPTTLLFGRVPVSFLSVEGWRHLVLPATSLAFFGVALLIRLARSGAQEALRQDYVRFARAKGLANARVIGVHVLRNTLIPIVSVIGLQFGALIALAIVTESVFAWPGMGKLLVDSIGVLDRPVIVAYVLVIVVFLVAINLAVDVLHSALDPRVRLTKAKG